ncbi:farnesol dehydrogenase-like [Eupeodes corollae]|uniref:farnesol dehydrogenase-like n=1 Tax=Eupeodes corollae TaxID=290404 RepID=UPI002492738F|nr:farnesol dehydrogenase-like [Eupeodes corollae]
MERWLNRVAVVTGASSGIGEAIAKDLVAAGVKVIALGRRLERLEKNKLDLSKSHQELYFPQKCDISNLDEVISTFEWIETTFGGTDILVNNAGILKNGNLVEMDPKVIDEVINTNLRGLIYCTQAAYKSMKKREFNGHIVHINSIHGHRVPDLSFSTNIYTPTKFAVTAVNEVLRKELNSLGPKIKTTSISPGVVQTEMAVANVFEGIAAYLQPEDVSQAVMFAISTPPHVQIHEIIVKPVGELI